MKLALLSDAVLPTPYEGGHGLGRMVSQIGEALIRRGHEVTLFAKQGSRFSGELVMPEDASGYPGEIALAREAMRLHRSDPFDAIFDHSHVHKVAELFPTAPTLNVYHDIYQEYRHNAVLLSEGQKALMSDAFRYAPVVHNALYPERFPFNDAPDDYVLFVGALSEIKQPLLAMEACALAGVKLVMAGGEIVGKMPFAGSERVEYVGAVGETERNRLMANARVFLQLGYVESFGLTTLEAGLCGTPVVAWASGGNTDTVVNGVNGVFVPSYGKDNARAVADAIDRAWHMSRYTCRNYVTERFSVDAQMDAYEHLLVRVAMGERWA